MTKRWKFGKQYWPGLAVLVVMVLSVIQLRLQGRRWWCECGQLALWWTDTQSSHNSQHLADPYSFTHVLHGMIIFGLLAWGLKRVSLGWQFTLAILVESLWELIENTRFVIDRYRETTMALGYEGDSIGNSFGDILCFAAGFWLARRVSFRTSVMIFVIIELVLLIWIKDSLLLNVIMLICPIDSIKEWQMGK